MRHWKIYAELIRDRNRLKSRIKEKEIPLSDKNQYRRNNIKLALEENKILLVKEELIRRFNMEIKRENQVMGRKKQKYFFMNHLWKISS